MLLEFFAEKDKDPINLILLRWYDEWPPKNTNKRYTDKRTELYGCPRLWFTDQYTCVYLESVDISVQIIPRNGCTNEFLVNKYIF